MLTKFGGKIRIIEGVQGFFECIQVVITRHSSFECRGGVSKIYWDD
jgi:hypothetical protein